MKAVIAAAGVGSRFFPVGKTIPKVMMPVWNRPLLAYAVADCVAAGVKDIAVVTAPGEGTRQVRHYLTPDPELEAYFAARGWQHKYAPLTELPDADFTIIEQPRDTRYGSALPVICAAEWIGADDFLLIAGDDLLLRDDEGSDLADLVQARTAAATPAAIAATAPDTASTRYGLRTRLTDDGLLLLDDLLRTPGAPRADTPLVHISRFLLPAPALPYFRATPPAANGELRAADAISAYARDHPVLVHPIRGTFYDCGNPQGHLTANIAVARIHGATI